MGGGGLTRVRFRFSHDSVWCLSVLVCFYRVLELTSFWHVALRASCSASFETLCRLECEWNGQSIVILDSVRIDPPYTARECRTLDGDQPGMDRALLMVSRPHCCPNLRAFALPSAGSGGLQNLTGGVGSGRVKRLP